MLVLIVLLALWQLLIVGFNIPTYLMPTPWQTLLTLWHSKLLLWQQTWPTLFEAIIGLMSAIACGCIVAVLMHISRWVRYFLQPIVLISQALPTIAVAPLFVVWLGFGLQSKMAVITLALFFPITASFYDGLQRVPAAYRDLAQLQSAGVFRQLIYIDMPSALPSLFSGIKIATAWAPITAVVSEWVGSSRGLGFLMLEANARVDMSLMFAALLVLIVISIVGYRLMDNGSHYLLSRYLT